MNARDRIGSGPSFNAKGARVAQNVADLHGDTLDQARMGNTLTRATALTEKGDPVKGFGDTPNQHDILTGSKLDGTAYTDGGRPTCKTGPAMETGQPGRSSSTARAAPALPGIRCTASRGCSQANLVSTGGNGYSVLFRAVTGDN